MAPRVQYATTADGVKIACVAVGDGPVLVYLQPHSHVSLEWELPESRDWYSLLAKRFRLVRLDFRRFGLSDRDVGEITVETCIADVDAVVGQLELERFHLIGVSGMSAVAAAYAARYPERVERLILWSPVATIAAWFGNEGVRERRRRATAALHDVDPELVMELHTRFMFGPDSRQDQVAFVRAAMRHQDYAAYEQFLWSVDVTDVLGCIAVPSLVVHPRRSEDMAMSASASFASRIPGATFADGDSEVYPFRGPDLRRNLELVDGFLRPLAEHHRAAEHVIAQAAERPLSPRELEVLGLLARGASAREIGETLDISVPTVNRHISNLYGKLGIHNRAQATAAYFGQLAEPQPTT